jgi:hypothetical protein
MRASRDRSRGSDLVEFYEVKVHRAYAQSLECPFNLG